MNTRSLFKIINIVTIVGVTAVKVISSIASIKEACNSVNLNDSCASNESRRRRASFGGPSPQPYTNYQQPYCNTELTWGNDNMNSRRYSQPAVYPTQPYAYTTIPTTLPTPVYQQTTPVVHMSQTPQFPIINQELTWGNNNPVNSYYPMNNMNYCYGYNRGNNYRYNTNPSRNIINKINYGYGYGGNGTPNYEVQTFNIPNCNNTLWVTKAQGYTPTPELKWKEVELNKPPLYHAGTNDQIVPAFVKDDGSPIFAI